LDIEIRKSSGRLLTGYFNFSITQKNISDLEVPNISQIPVITDNPAIGINGELRGVPRSLEKELTPYGRGVITLKAPKDWGPRIMDYPILQKTRVSFSLIYQGSEFIKHPDKDFRNQHPEVKFYKIPYFRSDVRISRSFDFLGLLNFEMYLDISNLLVSKFRSRISNNQELKNAKDYFDDLFANGKTDRVGSEDVSDKNILRTEFDALYDGEYRSYIFGIRLNL
jgi:hypothetical protein